ncbi:MAG: FtsB family cell division protein [Eubacteriales bacterium]
MKKKKKKKRINKGTSFILVIILGYFLYNFFLLEIQIYKQQNIKDNLLAELNQEKDRSQQLESELEQIDSNQYIESLARKYFGLVYPQEKVIIEVESNTN